MSLSTDRGDPECVEYHNWLFCIQDQQLHEELLEIVSIFSNILQFIRKTLQSLLSRIFQDCNSLIFFQGFKWVLCTPVEAAHIIATCENRLLVNHLTMDDYQAPLEMSFVSLSISIFC